MSHLFTQPGPIEIVVASDLYVWHPLDMAKRKPHSVSVQVTVDYTTSPLGTWHIEVVAEGTRFASADGSSIHAVFERALELLDAVSHANDMRPCETIHTLNGDAADFAVLAEQHTLRVPAHRGVGATIWVEGP